MTDNPESGGEQTAGADWRNFSPHALSERARQQAQAAPQPLRRSVYLYYLSRYLFSLYEAAFGSMPRQILNEYRNGLDHLMRFLSSGGALDNDDEHRNLHKMHGHLQRAVLDACKYHAYKTKEWLGEFEEKHGAGVLALVSDGKFWEQLQHGKKDAERAVEHAKLSDSALGERLEQNDDVVGAYLNAAHLWHGIRALCLDNAANIARARKEHGSIGGQAANISAKKQIVIAVVIGAAFFLLGAWLG